MLCPATFTQIEVWGRAGSRWIFHCFHLPSFPFPSSFSPPPWALQRWHCTAVHTCSDGYFSISCSEEDASSALPLAASLLLLTATQQWQFDSDPRGVIAVSLLHLSELILLCGGLHKIQGRLAIFPTKDLDFQLWHCTAEGQSDVTSQSTPPLCTPLKLRQLQHLFRACWVLCGGVRRLSIIEILVQYGHHLCFYMEYFSLFLKQNINTIWSLFCRVPAQMGTCTVYY